VSLWHLSSYAKTISNVYEQSVALRSMRISDFEIWLTMAIEMNNCVAEESLNAYAMYKKLIYEVRNITPVI
jgi:hypothetical protein